MPETGPEGDPVQTGGVQPDPVALGLTAREGPGCPAQGALLRRHGLGAAVDHVTIIPCVNGNRQGADLRAPALHTEGASSPLRPVEPQRAEIS